MPKTWWAKCKTCQQPHPQGEPHIWAGQAPKPLEPLPEAKLTFGVTENAIIHNAVTDIPKRGRGRPKSETTPAERQKQYRERKKATT